MTERLKAGQSKREQASSTAMLRAAARRLVRLQGQLAAAPQAEGQDCWEYTHDEVRTTEWDLGCSTVRLNYGPRVGIHVTVVTPQFHFKMIEMENESRFQRWRNRLARIVAGPSGRWQP